MSQSPVAPTPDPLATRQIWPLLPWLLVSVIIALGFQWQLLPGPAWRLPGCAFAAGAWMLTVLGVLHRTLLIRPRASLDLALAAVFAAAFGLLPWQGSLAVWHTGQWPAFWREAFPPIGAAALVGNLCAWLLSRWFGPRIAAPVVGSNRCLRILFLNQYYAPDMAPTGQVLHELAREMVAAGHTVEIICSCRSYDGGALYPAHEIRDGVRIQRLKAFGFGRRGFLGKLADYASFYGLLMFALMRLRRRPDVICALTTPPYIGVLARFAAGWQRCRHMHWVMDLYPEVLLASSMLKPGGVYRFLHSLKYVELRGASLVLALGPHMQRHLEKYLGAERIRWVPLWSEVRSDPAVETAAATLRQQRGWTDQRLVAMYSGNMGLGHRFDEFLAAADRLGPAGPRFVFSGGGMRKAQIEKFAAAGARPQIELMSYVPYEQLPAHLASADLHLISLDSAWQGLIVPSKTQGILAIGRPALFVGGRDNEIATWLLESGGGWVVAENDVTGLIAALHEAADPAERARRAAAGLQYARDHFNAHRNCMALTDLMVAAASAELPTAPPQSGGSQTDLRNTQ